MKGTAKRKVVTSGRLTGATRGSRGTADPRPAAQSEPAYSLYSTDSEDQVTTLHKGLDRCAALLSGMLQADNAASPSPPRAVKGAAPKSRRSAYQVKKVTKKPPAKTGQRGPGSTTPKARGAAVPAAHSGVKLHPPHGTPPRQPHATAAAATPPPPPPPQPSVLLSVHQSSSVWDGDLVPVRDVQSPRPEEEARAQTVQHLLGELKALISGQGSVAERLLTHLERSLSSPPPGVQADGVPSLLSENAQLRKRVRTLNQQLKERERAERQHDPETFLTSQVAGLQEELDAAQSRLRELQEDLSDLRRTLQDTQSQLRDRETENALMKTDLDATRRRLAVSEREKSEVASVAKQRLEEIGRLNRLLQSQGSSALPAVADRSHDPEACRQDPPAPPADRIALFLMSLSQTEPGTAQPDDARVSQTRREPEPERLADAGESAWSEWSTQSGSTFNTRDEAAFRDGLEALDASIASLQRTIQLDLRR